MSIALRPQHRLYVCFFLFAIDLGALMARLPDLQSALQIEKAELGLVLIGTAMGALVSLTFASPIVELLGARNTAFATVLGIPAILAIVPWMTSPGAVFGLLFLEGLLAGALEINVNVEIDRVEAQLGKGVMNRAHGFWSLGFFVTALASSAITQAGVPFQLHLSLTFVLTLILGGWAIWGMVNAPPRVGHATAGVPRIALPTLGLMPLCAVGIAALMLEGAGIDWSTIYMRDTFEVEPVVEGSALTAFALFMAIARLTVDPLVDRIGPRPLAATLMLIAAAGLTCVWLAPVPPVALLGFAMMGTGCSAVYPLAVSTAAQRTDRPAHVNVAALSQVCFVIFFLGPPILGFVAQGYGIRQAYLVCIPVIFVALSYVRALYDTKRLAISTI
jgi:MFS family permease